MAAFESRASLPPFSTQALPAFRQSENAWKTYVRPGLVNHADHAERNGHFPDSGADLRGRIRSSSVSPSGEGSEATLRMSAAIPAIRSGVSCNRSYIGSEGSLRAKSPRLAARISSDRRSAASATENSTRSIRSGSIRLSQPKPRRPVRKRFRFHMLCFA